MQGQASPQSAMFSYVSLEERIPASHPLRKPQMLIDSVLVDRKTKADSAFNIGFSKAC